MPLYVFDISGTVTIYKAANKKKLIDYIRDHLDNFQYMFREISLTDSHFKRDLKEIYDQPYEIFYDDKHKWKKYRLDIHNDKDWPRCKKLITKRIFNAYSPSAIYDSLSCDCNDHNTSPYVHVQKINESEIVDLD